MLDFLVTTSRKFDTKMKLASRQECTKEENLNRFCQNSNTREQTRENSEIMRENTSEYGRECGRVHEEKRTCQLTENVHSVPLSAPASRFLTAKMRFDLMVRKFPVEKKLVYGEGHTNNALSNEAKKT